MTLVCAAVHLLLDASVDHLLALHPAERLKGRRGYLEELKGSKNFRPRLKCVPKFSERSHVPTHAVGIVVGRGHLEVVRVESFGDVSSARCLCRNLKAERVVSEIHYGIKSSPHLRLAEDGFNIRSSVIEHNIGSSASSKTQHVLERIEQVVLP